MIRIIFRTALTLLTLKSAAFAVPFTLNLQRGGKPQIYVACTLAEVTGECLFDTGSAFSTIPSSQDVSGWALVGEMGSLGVGGRHPLCKKYRVSKFQVGEALISDFEIPQCSSSQSSRGGIGIDFFSAHSFFIDFKQNELIIDPSLPSQQVTNYPLKRLPNGQLKVPVKFGEVTVNALFDTAASPTVVDQEFVDRHPEFFDFVRDIEGSDGTVEAIKMKVYKAKMVKMGLGDFQFDDTWVVSMPLPLSLKRDLGENGVMILGLSHLLQLNWYFNLKENHWTYFP